MKKKKETFTRERLRRFERGAIVHRHTRPRVIDFQFHFRGRVLSFRCAFGSTRLEFEQFLPSRGDNFLPDRFETRSRASIIGSINFSNTPAPNPLSLL